MHDRNHLTAAEVDKLMAAVKGSRRAARDHRGLSRERAPARVMPAGQQDDPIENLLTLQLPCLPLPVAARHHPPSAHINCN